EQADAGEGRAAEQNEGRQIEVAAGTADLKHDVAEDQQNDDVGDGKEQATAHDSQQEIAATHRRGEEALEQFADAHIGDHETDTPHAAAHEVQADQTGQQKIDVAGPSLVEMFLLELWR